MTDQRSESAATLRLRVATLADVAALNTLIAESVRGLSRADYSPTQIEAAIGTAWGVDTHLIQDGTFFAVEAGPLLVGCGGWSKRRTLFGAAAHKDRQDELLDPSSEAARIRAFFVHPQWARRGIGRMLLEACETAARAHGFASAELVATLPGRRLYSALGYVGDECPEYTLPGGVKIEFVPMKKASLAL